jgi:GDPmannose 4,6-dehydratase
LFNHESPLRPARFVTQKVVRGAYRISKGSTETLALGDLSVVRDWGWAPNYVEAMWLMLQAEKAADFVIATGVSHSLQAFVAHAFAHFDLDWRQHVRHDEQLIRPNEIRWSQGNPAKAQHELGWRATHTMHAVVTALCKAQCDRAQH